MKFLRSCREVNGILAKRLVGDSIQYFMKWPNQSHDQCKWVNQDNLQIEKYIDDFEKSEKININLGISKRNKIENRILNRDPSQKQLFDLINSNVFMTKLEADHIVDVLRYKNQQILYLVKWKNANSCDLVYAEQLRTLYPQIVIQYYEKKLKLFLHKRRSETMIKKVPKTKLKRSKVSYDPNRIEDILERERDLERLRAKANKVKSK